MGRIRGRLLVDPLVALAVLVFPTAVDFAAAAAVEVARLEALGVQGEAREKDHHLEDEAEDDAEAAELAEPAEGGEDGGRPYKEGQGVGGRRNQDTHAAVLGCERGAAYDGEARVVSRDAVKLSGEDEGVVDTEAEDQERYEIT